MLLSVAEADLPVTSIVFRFTVPGHQQWALRSVFASAARAVGGAPERSYTLSVTDGTTIVATIPAFDNGAEPGTCQITWAQMSAATVASGSDGVTAAPLPPLRLNPGYQIVGEIINPAALDAWQHAVAWYDFVYTA